MKYLLLIATWSEVLSELNDIHHNYTNKFGFAEHHHGILGSSLGLEEAAVHVALEGEQKLTVRLGEYH